MRWRRRCGRRAIRRNSGAILAQLWRTSLTADPSPLQAGGGRGDRDRQAGGDDDEGGGIILGKKAGKNVGGKQINAAEMGKIRATIQARKIECGAQFCGAQNLLRAIPRRNCV